MADGKREAAIKVAEGEKQATILRAEGDRQASVLRAEGFALALGKIFDVARTVDAKTMSLQYLEALKALGAGPATKFIFPLEFTALLKPLSEFADKALAGEAATEGALSLATAVRQARVPENATRVGELAS